MVQRNVRSEGLFLRPNCVLLWIRAPTIEPAIWIASIAEIFGVLGLEIMNLPVNIQPVGSM